MKTEEYMALYLVRHYEDVRSIEFHPKNENLITFSGSKMTCFKTYLWYIAEDAPH
ncbi:hypothetical protein PCORN_01745 [Listeria cornellensis FSL F6-0969]|uniref:Uncharacterized protein n=1 Tax=Listeria cornellensis FSL F6-0969 TaxID=1265820 RepID=W7CA75_9LIST|nr:hypothetical protein PCORN_01745 [Listeria cornellensis FSL F6-0969]